MSPTADSSQVCIQPDNCIRAHLSPPCRIGDEGWQFSTEALSSLASGPGAWVGCPTGHSGPLGTQLKGESGRRKRLGNLPTPSLWTLPTHQWKLLLLPSPSGSGASSSPWPLAAPTGAWPACFQPQAWAPPCISCSGPVPGLLLCHY